MATRNIYFVRHGQTDANLHSIVQSPDTNLTDRGIHQAQKLADRLGNLTLDKVLTSPYPRARETADIIARKCELDIDVCELLREWDSPSSLWGIDYADPRSRTFSQAVYDNWNKGDWVYGDEESSQQIIDRVSRLLKYLITDTQGDVVCVSHGKLLRMVTLMIATRSTELGIYQESIRGSLSMTNTSISHVTVDDEGIMKLRTFGDSTHLS